MPLQEQFGNRVFKRPKPFDPQISFPRICSKKTIQNAEHALYERKKRDVHYGIIYTSKSTETTKK